MQQILFAKLDRRLAEFLISEYERTGSRVIHMTHEQIAQQISSAREVVARMLKRFAADGLVAVSYTHLELGEGEFAVDLRQEDGAAVCTVYDKNYNELRDITIK